MPAKITLKCYCESDDQKRQIEASATSAGLSVSQFLLRRALSQGPTRPSKLVDPLVELEAAVAEIVDLISRHVSLHDPSLGQPDSFDLLAMAREIHASLHTLAVVQMEYTS